MDGTNWDWLLRLALAALVGALIGGERESRGHPAGVRTQALVALAAALLTRVGQLGFDGSAADVSRIASQVVTGIGFIGAGVILKHRGNITGLTTAATLFLSAGLGVAIGAGLIVPALMTTAIALVVIYGLRLVKPVIRRRVTQTVEIDYVQGYGTFGPVLRTVQGTGGTVQDLRVEDDSGGGGLRRVSIQVLIKAGSELEEKMADLLERPEVRDVRVMGG